MESTATVTIIHHHHHHYAPSRPPTHLLPRRRDGKQQRQRAHRCARLFFLFFLVTDVTWQKTGRAEPLPSIFDTKRGGLKPSPSLFNEHDRTRPLSLSPENERDGSFSGVTFPWPPQPPKTSTNTRSRGFDTLSRGRAAALWP